VTSDVVDLRSAEVADEECVWQRQRRLIAMVTLALLAGSPLPGGAGCFIPRVQGAV
jgi:hypothetical protein